MSIKRFYGKNSKEVFREVHKELGADAVILSNRLVNGGNEILALKEEDLHEMVEQTRSTDLTKSSPTMPQAQHAFATTPPVIETGKHEEQSHAASALEINVPAHLSKPTMSPQHVDHLMKEMRDMRQVIESKITTMSWGNIQQQEPIKSEMLNRLLTADFSPALSRYIAENLPANQDTESAINWIKSTIDRNLIAEDPHDGLLPQKGIYALIGPTGVGKTTTTAKLASRYVMKYGSENLGLISTDAYRVGGQEQLRIYAKILGVMIYAVKDEAELKMALNELKNKHTILIDTVGVGQRDNMVIQQIEMLSKMDMPIQKLLCLNATSTGETLSDVISAYSGNGLDGCILTKLDEAIKIGSALDVIIRAKLKLFFTTNGQRVPEDIHLTNKSALIERAFKVSQHSSRTYDFLENELPLIMGSTVSSHYEGLRA
jgi:flagellar biosynthesis protein FlhF